MLVLTSVSYIPQFHSRVISVQLTLLSLLKYGKCRRLKVYRMIQLFDPSLCPFSSEDREYLRHLPPIVMAIFVAIELGFIGLLLAMNWVTEFARIGATSLVFPFILLTYAITRECFLPRWALLRPHLEHVSAFISEEIYFLHF